MTFTQGVQFLGTRLYPSQATFTPLHVSDHLELQVTLVRLRILPKEREIFIKPEAKAVFFLHPLWPMKQLTHHLSHFRHLHRRLNAVASPY